MNQKTDTMEQRVDFRRIEDHLEKAIALIPDDDRLVISVDKAIALEAAHELVKGGARAPYTVIGQCLADNATWPLPPMEHAEDEELQMRQIGDMLSQHNVTLCTITLTFQGV